MENTQLQIAIGLKKEPVLIVSDCRKILLSILSYQDLTEARE